MTTLRAAVCAAAAWRTGEGGGRDRMGQAARSQSGASRFVLALLLLLLSALGAFAQSGGLSAPNEMDIWHRAAHAIVQPWVTIGLLVAGCLLLYHEMLTPHTWGLTGNLGTICIGLVIASQVMVGDTGWVGVLLLLVGLALILLEVHVTPGYGVAIGGFILMFAGMFLSLGGTRNTAFALGVASILIVVSGLAFLSYLPKSPAWQRQIERMRTASAAAAMTPFSTTDLIGKTGTALTPLRPAGVADIGGAKVNVVTEGDFLSEGARVLVEAVEGDRIVVQMLEPSPISAA